MVLNGKAIKDILRLKNKNKNEGDIDMRERIICRFANEEDLKEFGKRVGVELTNNVIFLNVSSKEQSQK